MLAALDLRSFHPCCNWRNSFPRGEASRERPANVLQQLAAENTSAEINYRQCLALFARRTGLDAKLVDHRQTLKRSDVEEFFTSRLIGQPVAVDAILDVIGIAKSQLSDGKRPLGALLFAGPTGVGKTEAAKLLAEFLFDDAEHLLRFDLNEFVDPGSAQRLIGTFDQPDGLLTSAVRQQPYNVLLLDEVEKAHPEVFDLLLQVLGEGRLTDARGRTVDFTKMIIIMTSNVGAASAATAIGFVDNEETAQQRFLSAVRGFWKPEFFNRIDRIVPFRRLEREDLAKIADLLIGKLLDRRGFQRRPVTVMGSQDVIDWVVDRGYHEKLGGRAMRRAVERDLVAPIAAIMSGMLPDERAILRLFRSGDGIVPAILPLTHPDPNLTAQGSCWQFHQGNAEFYVAADQYIDSMLVRCERLKGSEAFDDHTHPLAFERIATMDFLRRMKAKSKALARYQTQQASGRIVNQSIRRPADGRFKAGRKPRWTAPASSPDRRFAREVHAFQDMEEYLNDGFGAAGLNQVEITDSELAFQAFLDDLRVLPIVVPKVDWDFQRVVVLIRALNRQARLASRLMMKALRGIGCSQIDVGTAVNEAQNNDDREHDGLHVQRLYSESLWKKQLSLQQNSAKSQKLATLRAPAKPDWVLDDSVLNDLTTGALIEGNNALSWLQPIVGTHRITTKRRSAVLQVIVRQVAENQSPEDTIRQLIEEHRKHDCVQMNNPQDPFHLRPVVLDADASSDWPQQVAARIARSLPLPEELHRAIDSSDAAT